MLDSAASAFRCRHCGAAISRDAPVCGHCGERDPIAAEEGREVRQLATHAQLQLRHAERELDEALAISRSWQWFVEGYALQLFAVGTGAFGVLSGLILRGTHPVLLLAGSAALAAATLYTLHLVAAPQRSASARAAAVLAKRTSRCPQCGGQFIGRPSAEGTASCPWCGTRVQTASVDEFEQLAARSDAAARFGEAKREQAETQLRFRDLRESGVYPLSNRLWLIGAALLWTALLVDTHWFSFRGPEIIDARHLNVFSLAACKACAPVAKRPEQHGMLGAVATGFLDPESLLVDGTEADACFDGMEATYRIRDLPSDAVFVGKRPGTVREAVDFYRETYGSRAEAVARPVALCGTVSESVRIQGLRERWDVHALPCGYRDTLLIVEDASSHPGRWIALGAGYLALAALALYVRRVGVL